MGRLLLPVQYSYIDDDECWAIEIVTKDHVASVSSWSEKETEHDLHVMLPHIWTDGVTNSDQLFQNVDR